MKEKVKRQKAKVVSPLARILKLGIALFTFAFCLFPFALSSSAHEPITTKVRFNKELIRILQRNCLSCHRPGGIAFSLATYDEARPWSKAIKEEVLEKRMPPWRAVKGYGDFNNAPSLTQRDVDLIVNWVEGGAPKGDDNDLPKSPLFTNGWTSGQPDLILKTNVTATIAADANEHQLFTLSPTLKEDRWLSAIDVVPGNSAVVHCATIYLLTPDSYQWPAGPLVQKQPRERVPMSSVPSTLSLDRPPRMLAKWIPGQKPVAFEPGTALLIPAGSSFSVFIHYKGTGEPTTDHTAIGLYFSKSQPRRQVYVSAIKDVDGIVLESTKPNRIVLTSTAKVDAEAVAIRPSTHRAITSLQATAYRPDGTQEVLIWVRGDASDWQQTYYFRRAVPLPKGTRVEIIAYIDRTDESSEDPAGADLVSIAVEPFCTLFTTTSDASTVLR